MLLITSADHYVGHCLTSHLSRYPALRSQIRILCENKSQCLNFSKKGIDACQVDYTHPNDLSKAMKGVDHMIMAIGFEAKRVNFNKNLCQVASRSGVKSITCISHVGADSSSHDTLQQYSLIEEAVINTDCQWTILRLDWISQQFHFWAPYIERHRALPMPMPEDVVICPIDITDVCRVVECLVLSANKQLVSDLHDLHSGQVYILTGPQPVTGKELLTVLESATGFSKFDYQLTRPMDIAYYLSGLCRDIWFDAYLKREKSQIYNDTLEGYAYRTRTLNLPTDTQIRTFLEYFDWAMATSGSEQISHTTQITQVPARSINRFFQENACKFKPRV